MQLDNKYTDIHPNAIIGQGVKVGSFSVIEEDVEIGDGTEISCNVTICRGTRIGKNCKIFPGAVLGAVPQDLKFMGEYTQLTIGDNVTVRECCTLNRGTKALGYTSIGSNVLLMAYVHVAHDCVIGDHTIVANSVNLAGHVHIAEHVIIGGMCAIHQFVKIGEHAMIGGGSLVRKDVPPFVKASREPLSYVGTNSIGLERRGFSAEDIQAIQDIYRILFVKSNNLKSSLDWVRLNTPDSIFKSRILEFIEKSERGLMRGFRHGNEDC